MLPARLFAWLLVMCSAGVMVGQDPELLPALRQELTHAKDDTVRARTLAQICFNLIRIDPESALIIGEQGLALAIRIGDQRALGDAHNNLGWLAAEQGHLDRADSLLSIALSIFQKLGVPEHTSVTLSNLGWVAEKKGDSVGSVKRFQEALRMSEAANDTASASILLYSLGISYRKIKDHEQSIAHLERSREYERLLGRKGKEANCLVAIANTLKEAGDSTRARVVYADAIDVYKQIPDHQGWGITEENLGDLELKARPRQALVHYLSALEHYEAIHSNTDRAYVLQRIATAHLALNEVLKAEASLVEGAALSRDAGDPQLTLEYEMALARLFAKKGDGDGAVRHFERFVHLKDSLQGNDTQRELARLRTEFETERKEKDNALLRAKNSEQAERIRRNQQRLFAITLIAALALVAAALFFRNYRQKQRHAIILEQLNERLATSNQEIVEINGLLELKLLRSQMNPHFIYNSLSSAARMTQAGKHAEALAYLHGFARLLRQVLDHSVDDRVSVEAEADFLRQFLKLEAVRLDGLTFTVDADPELLDEMAEVPALIVQPFVENAVLHGLAGKQGERRIEVRFNRAGLQVRCTIVDNGVGRSAAQAAEPRAKDHRSLGIQLTQERLLLLTRRLGGDRSVRTDDLVDHNGAPLGTRVTLLL